MKRIEFGRYFKDDTKEKEKIEWIVLEENEETLFVVSTKALVSRPFDQLGNSWDKSDIRKWLNTEFYEVAFKPEERRCIKRTALHTYDVFGYRCCSTQDELFLLSFDEVEKYFPAPASRVIEKSSWAQYTLGENEKDTNDWWLRDKGDVQTSELAVLEDGTYETLDGIQNNCGIRPAMRILRNYSDFAVPDIPILEGQMMLFDNGRCAEDLHMETEAEVDQILTELGMGYLGNHRDFNWLKEVILFAVHNPNTWQGNYLEMIGKREHITRERVRQILYKAVWDHWNAQSAVILSNHFENPIQTQFERVKPNHIEFITMLSKELRDKYQLGLK